MVKALRRWGPPVSVPETDAAAARGRRPRPSAWRRGRPEPREQLPGWL